MDPYLRVLLYGRIDHQLQDIARKESRQVFLATAETGAMDGHSERPGLSGRERN